MTGVSRRRFLGLLGLAPAIPLINRLPALTPTPLATGGVVRSSVPYRVGEFTASGGWCAPLSSTYKLHSISAVNHSIFDSLPPIKAARGGIHFATQGAER